MHATYVNSEQNGRGIILTIENDDYFYPINTFQYTSLRHGSKVVLNCENGTDHATITTELKGKRLYVTGQRQRKLVIDVTRF